MFCTNCGNKLGSEDNFCGNCGKPVRANTTPKPEIETPAPKIEQPVFHKPVIRKESDYTPPITPTRSKTAEAKAEKKREELRADLKKLMEKEQGREISDSELFEAEHWLRGYAEVVADIGMEEFRRQEKLKENPKGFHLEGEGYTCFICGNHVSNEQTWYDKHGIKCLVCQEAVDKKIIPATAASDKDSWYSTWDFERSFFINRYGLRRLVKEGLLKPRIVPGTSGRPHYQLFFIEDHKDILPPKKLTSWPMVRTQKDGADWYHSEPWIYHKDAMEVLKDYKILDIIKTLTEKEVIKDFPQLKFQLSQGAKSLLKVNFIDKKEPEEPDLEHKPEP